MKKKLLDPEVGGSGIMELSQRSYLPLQMENGISAQTAHQVEPLQIWWRLKNVKSGGRIFALQDMVPQVETFVLTCV